MKSLDFLSHYTMEQSRKWRGLKKWAPRNLNFVEFLTVIQTKPRSKALCPVLVHFNSVETLNSQHALK